MDVAKYIGLFLLKNNFVYIHGLGNLELRKKSASYDGSSLQPPAYEIVMSSQGSIDDNLANFIATNEQISISKASNALREFSQAARAELQAGKPVVIPAVGSFVEERGKIVFVTDANFSYAPPSIPSIRVARRQDETVYTTNADIPVVKPRYIDPDTEVETTGISWVKIAAWGIILIAVCAGAYFGIQYMRSHDNTNVAPLIQPVLTDSLQQPASVNIVDSTQLEVDSMARMNAADSALLSFDVIVNTYTNLAKAQERAGKLKSYGHHAEMVAEDDSSAFYVIIPITNIAPADTSALLDSFRRTFRPVNGIKMLQ